MILGPGGHVAAASNKVSQRLRATAEVNMLRVSLRQMTYFVSAADTGNIAEAARLLNVAQPSVSWSILKMEELLGLDLFVRQHAKGVTLTPAGHRLLAGARAILHMAEEFEQTATAQADELAGTLTVGCYSTLAAAYVPPVIAEFARLHPKVKLEIVEDTVDGMLERLYSGRIEVALAYDVDLPDDVMKLRICSARPYALLFEGHRLLKQNDVSLVDLQDDPFVLLNTRPAAQYFLSLFDAVGVKPNIAHSSPSFEVVRSLVAQGMGYTVLVTRPHSDMTYDGLRVHPRPLSDDLPEHNVCTVRAGATRMTRRCAAFQQICLRLFAGPVAPAASAPARP